THCPRNQCKPSLILRSIRKRQRTDALQDASNWDAFKTCASFWSAAPLCRTHSFGLTSELHPLLPRNSEDECRKTSESGFPFKDHSIFLGHSTRRLIIGMDQRKQVP